jgi:hypothetical protein
VNKRQWHKAARRWRRQRDELGYAHQVAVLLLAERLLNYRERCHLARQVLDTCDPDATLAQAERAEGGDDVPRA